MSTATDINCQRCGFPADDAVNCRCGAVFCATCAPEHACQVEPVRTLELFDYQHDLVRGVHDLIRAGQRTVVFVMSTGSGKRYIQCWWAMRAAKQGKRVLFVVNRRTLVRQFSDELRGYGIPHRVMMGDETTLDEGEPITVASLATLRRRHFFDQHNQPSGVGLPEADLLLIDEAHLDLDSYAMLFGFYPDAIILGATATPIGSDGKALTELYPAMHLGIPKSELIRRGRLVPTVMYAPSEPDVRGVTIRNRDFAAGELEQRVRECTVFAHVFDEWQPWSDLPTVVFAPGVEFAHWLAKEWNRRGYTAECVDAKTKMDDRARIFDGVKSGEIRVVVSVDVLKIGVDVPAWQVGVDLQPTMQLRGFIQKTGRVCRASPGKTEAVWLDFCLDSQTEILTKRGWAGREQIKDDDLVAGFDRDTSEISWQPITSRIDRSLQDGERMVEASSDRIDIRVTGNHRIVLKRRKPKWSLPMPKREKGKHRKWNGKVIWPESWEFDEAFKLADVPQYAFKIPVSGVETSRGLDLTDDELRFVGWFVTDGTMNRTTVTIYQAEHQPQLADLRSCLAGCGFDFGERTTRNRPLSQKTQLVLNIPKGTCKSNPRRGWVRLAPYLDKNLSPLLDQMTERQFETFLHAVHLGDGDKDRLPWSYRITTGNRVFADRLQSLCVRRGFKCNIKIVPPRGSISKNPKIILNIKKQRDFTIYGKNYSGGAVRFRESVASLGEQVWCVSNPLETLVVRRNGKVAIIGNSGAYHRCGHPDEDIAWNDLQADETLEELAARHRKKPEAPDPIVCPKCKLVRKHGPKCPGCGHEAPKVVRLVRMGDGHVRQMAPPRPKSKKQPAMVGSLEWQTKNWIGALCRAGQSGKTVRQARYLYKSKTKEWPPNGLPKMPAHDSADWDRKASDVYPWTAKRKSKA